MDNIERNEITACSVESEKSIQQIADPTSASSSSSSSPLISPPVPPQEASPPQEVSPPQESSASQEASPQPQELSVNLSMKRPLDADNVEEIIPKKRKARPNFSPEIVHILMQWLKANILKPYPTKNEKRALCYQTGLTIRQVNIKSFFNFFQLFSTFFNFLSRLIGLSKKILIDRERFSRDGSSV